MLVETLPLRLRYMFNQLGLPDSVWITKPNLMYLDTYNILSVAYCALSYFL